MVYARLRYDTVVLISCHTMECCPSRGLTRAIPEVGKSQRPTDSYSRPSIRQSPTLEVPKAHWIICQEHFVLHSKLTLVGNSVSKMQTPFWASCRVLIFFIGPWASRPSFLNIHFQKLVKDVEILIFLYQSLFGVLKGLWMCLEFLTILPWTQYR